MVRRIKIKRIHDEACGQVQISLYDTGHSFEIHKWDEASGENAVVETIQYEDQIDRIAALAMARGCMDSLYQQEFHEIHGDSFTDKRRVCWYWSDELNRYVTVPEDDDG